jgi:hypothetical protein
MSICSTILLTCGSKPMSSILSASSRARYLIDCKHTLALSNKSTKRPGVATRMSTPLSRSLNCKRRERNTDVIYADKLYTTGQELQTLYVKKYNANGISEELCDRIHAYVTAKLSQVCQDSRTQVVLKIFIDKIIEQYELWGT